MAVAAQGDSRLVAAIIAILGALALLSMPPAWFSSRPATRVIAGLNIEKRQDRGPGGSWKADSPFITKPVA
jgi:hypothetical protein